MKHLLLLSSLLLAGCTEPVVSKDVHSDLASKVNITQSCHKAAMCYQCDMRYSMMKGDFDYVCGMRYSTTCGGSQDVTVWRTPVTLTYESGRKEESYTDSAPLSTTSVCK